eukprot:jgi/Galph1/5909/GphlegSOOS_G4638.1
MEKTDKDSPTSSGLTSSFSKKCSVLSGVGMEGTGSYNNSSQVIGKCNPSLNERGSDNKTQGKLRPLVPFFVPGEETVEGTPKINEALTLQLTKDKQETFNKPLEVKVRTWDREQGFFEETVHRVTEPIVEQACDGRELQNSTERETAIEEIKRRLLTPDSILARASAKRIWRFTAKEETETLVEKDIRRELDFSEQMETQEKKIVASKNTNHNHKPKDKRRNMRLNNEKQLLNSKSSSNARHQRSDVSSAERHDHQAPLKGFSFDLQKPRKQGKTFQFDSKSRSKGSSSRDNIKVAADLNESRRYAGRSYDTASPPPASLPLPSFSNSLFLLMYLFRQAENRGALLLCDFFVLS